MSTKYYGGVKYLPLNSQDVDKSGGICVIPFGKLAWITVSLPFIGFVFCVVWSVAFDFKTTVSTHCNVFNLLPSISAAIGNESPQNIVWQLAIAIHAPTRFLVVWMYRRYYSSVLRPSSYCLSATASFLNVVENIALLGLTFFSSAKAYPVHEKCFITFIACSEMYMMLCCYLLGQCRAQPGNKIEARSLLRKRQLLFINVVSFGLAAYCFLRHNWYCEPYVYSLFAVFEYLVVLTNMAFHMTAYYDLYDKRLTLALTKISLS